MRRCHTTSPRGPDIARRPARVLDRADSVVSPDRPYSSSPNGCCVLLMPPRRPRSAGRRVATPVTPRSGLRVAVATPSYPPEPIDHYLLYVYEGDNPAPATLVATYPRQAVGTFTSPDPGGLQPGTPYTLQVLACDTNGAAIGAAGQTRFKTGG